MGGKSSSSSSSSTTNIAVDERIAATDNAIVVGKGGTFIQSDQGALDAAAAMVSDASTFGVEAVKANAAAAVASANASAAAAQAGLAANTQVTGRALDTVDRSVDEALDFATAANFEANERLAEINKQAFDVAKVSATSIGDFADRALDKVDSANRDEAARNIEALLNTVSTIAMGAAAAWAISRFAR